MAKYRVKAFLFVDADSERAAEAVAQGFANDAHINPDIPFEMTVREKSAKLVPEKEKERA